MKKLQILSIIILLLSILNIFAFVVVKANEGSQKLGFLGSSIKSFSQFPQKALDAFKEVSEPRRLVKVDSEFIAVNELNYDIYAINGHFDSGKWIITLINLRNDSLVHKWFLEESSYKDNGRVFSYSQPRGPILLEDKSIVLTSDESNNLYRLDKDSNLIWHNSDSEYHHSINLSVEGNIWACTRNLKTNSNNSKVNLSEHIINSTIEDYNNTSINYYDDSFAKIDINTGRTIFSKSISEILYENGLSYFIHGMQNKQATNGNDPLHLNDIQPTLSNGPFWKKGDLFLSFRHRSLILLYRPETNKVLRIIQGPFYNQHDVDIQSDSTISFFNNNISSFTNVDAVKKSKAIAKSFRNLNSEVLIYNLKDSTFNSYLPLQFENEKILSLTQGLHEILLNGDLFVENQNSGTVFILSGDSILLKKYYNTPVNNLVERTNWVRIYEKLNFKDTK